MTEAAADDDLLHVIDMCESKRRKTTATFAAACGYGSIEMIDYLQSQNCPSDSTSVTEAARAGRADVLEYIVYVIGIPWTCEAYYRAAELNRLEVLRWADGHGLDRGTDAWEQALDLPVFRYLHAIDYPMTSNTTCFAAARKPCMDTLTFLRSIDVPWSQNFAARLLRHNCYEKIKTMLGYIIEHGGLWSILHAVRHSYWHYNSLHQLNRELRCIQWCKDAFVARTHSRLMAFCLASHPRAGAKSCGGQGMIDDMIWKIGMDYLATTRVSRVLNHIQYAAADTEWNYARRLHTANPRLHPLPVRRH